MAKKNRSGRFFQVAKTAASSGRLPPLNRFIGWRIDTLSQTIKVRGMRKLRALILCLVFAAFALAPLLADAAAPETRKWTSTAGTKIDAVLVQYDASSVTLRFANGSEKKIPSEQLSDPDLEYLKQFESLKKESPPWVSLSAKTGAAGRTRFIYTTTQKKALDIEVVNRAQEGASIELLWLMLGKDLETKSEVVIDYGMWKGDLGAGETKAFRTPASTTQFSSGGRYYSYYGGYYYYSTYYYPRGSEITSFLVQARWKGQVLDSVTGASSDRIKELAKSQDVIAGLTEAGFKVDSALAKQIRDSLSTQPTKK